MEIRDISISVLNTEEFERKMGREYHETVQAKILGESGSKKFFVCIINARYAVFEKSADGGFDGEVSCVFRGCKAMGPEEDGVIREIRWRENSGCVSIFFFDWLIERSDSVCVVWDEELYEAKERRFCSAKYIPGFLARKKTARSLLGKIVDIEIDRPAGYVRGNLTYPVNYGFVPGVLGGDGEELDVYLLGVTEPVSSFKARIIGIIHRENDNEDKLVAVPDGVMLTKEEIAEQTRFQEQYYDTFVETQESFYECKMRDCAFDGKIPAELEHLLLKKTISYFRDNVFGLYSFKEFSDYISAFEQAGKSKEYTMRICKNSEYVTNPRTLFTAVWREYRRQGCEITPEDEIEMNFSFRENCMAVAVSVGKSE